MSNLGALKKPRVLGRNTDDVCKHVFSRGRWRERGSDDGRTIFRSSVFGRMEGLGGSSRTPSWWKDCGAAERTPPPPPPPRPPPPIGRHTRQILFIYLFIFNYQIFYRSVCTHPSVIICPELRFARTHDFLLANEMLQHVGNHHHHLQLPPAPFPWKACVETMVTLSWLLSSTVH